MSSASPIAIVGMSCRLSGGVSTPEDLWTMIARSRDGWGPIPKDRFSADAYYHPNPQKKGCFNVKSGYFMDKDLSQFDAPFFNITEQEAIAMGKSHSLVSSCEKTSGQLTLELQIRNSDSYSNVHMKHWKVPEYPKRHCQENKWESL